MDTNNNIKIICHEKREGWTRVNHSFQIPDSKFLENYLDTDIEDDISKPTCERIFLLALSKVIENFREEEQIRLDQESKDLENEIERDLKEFERLKAKYENK